jgi:hypothetical protein
MRAPKAARRSMRRSGAEGGAWHCWHRGRAEQVRAASQLHTQTQRRREETKRDGPARAGEGGVCWGKATAAGAGRVENREGWGWW